VFTLLTAICFWLVVNVSSFTNGPGSRSARIAAARTVLYAMVAVFFALTLLGRADGVYSRTHPDRNFDRVRVTLISGDTIEGYLAPIDVSLDTFILPDRPADSVIRIPASGIERIDTLARN